MSCPVCASTAVVELIDIPSVPVFCNQICPSRDQALDAAKAPMDLSVCRGCGHLFNSAFDPTLVTYSPEYENSLHFSGTFQTYASGLAASLAERYTLRGKTVVEIGCGRGDFLRDLCRVGGSRGYGFDPSAPATTTSEGVTIVRESFSSAHTDIDADLVTCRHCLEHVADPIGFLQSVRELLRGNDGAGVFFEVPNALYTLRDGGIWDLIYEHCGYFTASSLARAFDRAGFFVEEVAETFGGQFMTVFARPSSAHEVEPPNAAAARTVDRHAGGFARTYRSKVGGWRDRLVAAHAAKRSVVVWGAGSKGTTFLNTVSSDIRYVVDINPRKQGMFVACSGQEIVAPARLRDIRPDLVVVMNPNYVDEVGAQLRDLGVEVELAAA